MSRVLILGSGVSGIAAARLAVKVGMVPAIYTEGADTAALGAGFGVATGSWDPVLLNGVDLVVTSPGFPERSLPIVEALEWGIPVWSEIEFASRHLTCPIVAVTGTNGKTTVTEATAAMLAVSGSRFPATGNIGSPLSDQVGNDNDGVVVEVSSFQLRFCDTFHPIAAAVTNVAVDHLDWHGSEVSYREAKARIFANQTKNDLLVYDFDDEGATALARRASTRVFPVSGVSMPAGGGGVIDDRLVVGPVDIAISDLASGDGTHLANLAMAASLALHAGATPAGVAEAARGFHPGPHRRETVLERGGVTWVDDSKATNLHAALASVRGREAVVLIAGGLAKGVDVSPLAEEPNVRHLIGIGAAGAALVEAAGSRGHLARTMEEAVSIAGRVSRPGDTVLLAPGCASFDQFESYAERGEEFTRFARSLPSRSS